ncbi:hypothetical protein [Halodesulfovibrio sp.]|nr:hypothetical protein [Halodesulfovibrio sp.]MCT4535360.1 hypothetical protein [Halodesulfovibrio sp.]
MQNLFPRFIKPMKDYTMNKRNIIETIVFASTVVALQIVVANLML